MSDFSVDLSTLKRREKPSSEAVIAKADAAGEKRGFVDRSVKARRGRPKSERTGQVHAKVLPHVVDEIAAEATRRGVTQGVIVEEGWALYRAQQLK
ncbi:chromosome partitioning protein ParB [Aureimonas psammosilenae]|uniref:chromosome partitioning protein ParB n=1 Tax=Aureimonas psammosilenae TaxID=2495496 RepID=UPI001261156F|nr:chromosome partitioning protein ParB [Aureimonas psammosilenae]